MISPIPSLIVKSIYKKYSITYRNSKFYWIESDKCLALIPPLPSNLNFYLIDHPTTHIPFYASCLQRITMHTQRKLRGRFVNMTEDDYPADEQVNQRKIFQTI